MTTCDASSGTQASPGVSRRWWFGAGPKSAVWAALVFAWWAGVTKAAWEVSTDFEGGSAREARVDELAGVIRFQPGGDPGRGWPCWWFLRIEGVAAGQLLRLELSGSERPVRNQGQDTGKPLSPDWAMPTRAAWSADGETWQVTDPGIRDAGRITYGLVGTGNPLWVAWGPPFTARDGERLIAAAVRALPGLAHGFDLATTREGRTVRGLRVGGEGAGAKPAVWIQARQHAWESGSSWVAQGMVDWFCGEEAEARHLRAEAEIRIIPVMDVDNVATGNGGKEADPRDHNRDWSDAPVYPEVAASQRLLRSMTGEGRLALFLDLHNPGPLDVRPFFFVGPPELLPEEGRMKRAGFLRHARWHLDGPVAVDPVPRITAASYHPLWRQISGQWVNDHGNAHTVAACLETPWNTPQGTVEGYREVGVRLGRAVASFLREP